MTLRRHLAAAALALVLATPALAQDFVFGFSPRTGDAFVDAQLGDINVFARGDTNGFIDDVVVSLGAPRALVRDLYQTRLQLQRDGDAQTYDLEETYLGADGEAVFTQAGKWVQEDGDGVSFHLDPDTPGGRRYALRADGSLDLLDSHGAPLEPAGHYRLQRL